ncbi:ROK family protein [Marinoscillum furvescens]|uniref:Glucokinase n=1 Tax=Marinoscillum furvescens DSM 4134 TaxID=1122208 RepID=A0A3D9KWY2_MARFU|nr:ROK family protein [Marinoscillum furvescens]RED93026.1 glucokinase [Marinoscillum furvescens DSM 4134]
MNSSSSVAIGVCIAGKGIKCAAVNLSTNKIVPGSFVESSVRADGSARHICTLWAMNIRKSIERSGADRIAGVGFSIPGNFDYTNGVGLYRTKAKFGELYQVNVKDEIVKRLGLDYEVPVRFVNDAIGFAIGGQSMARDTSNVVYIIIEDGFGSGFISNGYPVLKGANVPAGGVVYNLPFKDGIAEDFFSANGVLKAYQESGGKMFINTRSLINAGHHGHAQVSEIFQQFGQDLGEVLAPVLKKFNASKVVFGGNLGRELDLYGEQFRASLATHGCTSAVEKESDEQDLFVVGGAQLTKDQYWMSIESLLPLMD